MADDDATQSVRETLAELSGQEPAVAEPEPPVDAGGLDDDDRHAAISEILAELRGDSEGEEEPAEEPAEEPGGEAEPEPEAGEKPVEPGPAPEPPQSLEPEPHGGEQDEEAEPVAGPPADDSPSPPESPAPHQRQAAQADPRPLPQASTPRSLILLHAFLVAAFALLSYVGYRRMASTLLVVKDELGGRPAGAQATVRPQPPEPGPAEPRPDSLEGSVLQIDEGLRYAQEMEKADLLFEKAHYVAAAAAYKRALTLMPPSWDDGAAAFRLGECYLRLRNYPRAIVAYERVAAAYPSGFKPRALFQLGEVHLRLQAYRRARECFYDLLLRQEQFGDDAATYIRTAYYRIADCYRLEAESLPGVLAGAGAAPAARAEGGQRGAASPAPGAETSQGDAR